MVVHGTLQCLFLQRLFLQRCKCLWRIFWERTGFETSHSLTLLYPHIESLKCLSQPSPWAPGWLCPTGQSWTLCDDTQDKGAGDCVLLTFPAYLLGW